MALSELARQLAQERIKQKARAIQEEAQEQSEAARRKGAASGNAAMFPALLAEVQKTAMGRLAEAIVDSHLEAFEKDGSVPSQEDVDLILGEVRQMAEARRGQVAHELERLRAATGFDANFAGVLSDMGMKAAGVATTQATRLRIVMTEAELASRKKGSARSKGATKGSSTDALAGSKGNEPETKGARVSATGRWRILESLSEGGQGHVFLVTESGSDGRERFILKRFKNPKRIERTRREIVVTEELEHPNIVRFIDADAEAERPYMVVEYCEGGALDKADLTRLSILERLRLFRGICVGIAFAHGKGVVHRDLKPANIFLRGDGRTPVIGDFGLTFRAEGDARLTIVDEAIGSANYRAPEMEDGFAEDVAPSADVYSLGKVLYWLLAGRIFAREKHREADFDLTKSNAIVPNFLVYELLDRMIVADPGQRLRDGGEVLREVDSVIERVEARAHVVSLDAPQPCLFCGVGHYRPAVTYGDDGSNSAAVHNFGLTPVTAHWLILVCDYCGNVQLFRPDIHHVEARWKVYRGKRMP